MEFTFPDSGKKIEIERVSFTTLGLLRAHYEVSYPNKPVEPRDPLEDNNDGDVSSDSFKEKRKEYLAAKEQYEKDLATWQQKVTRATWKATQLMYARHLKEFDIASITRVEKDAHEFGMNLREQVLQEYRDANVPFDESLMDKYIYLWLCCITTSAESNLFHSEMTIGSKPTQEAVQKSLYLFRS